MDEPARTTPELPLAPPTTPRPLPKRPTSWPLVLGVVMILFGVAGALAGIAGILQPFWNRTMAMPGQEALFEVQKKYLALTVTLGVLGMGLGALLAIGGTMTVRRRPAARGVVLIWAGLKLLFVLVGTVQGAFMQGEMFSTMNQATAGVGGGAGNPAFSGPGLQAIMVVGVVVGLAWGCALPVIVLLWFNRAIVRRETSDWR